MMVGVESKWAIISRWCEADATAFWNNFERIVEMLAMQGESFEAADFLTKLSDGQTLLKSAVDHQAIGKVFTVDIWQGRFDEMLRLWHEIGLPERRAFDKDANGILPLALKRAVLASEGRDMPEDRLARGGLAPGDIFRALLDAAAFEDTTRRLTQAGDRWRKEYLMLLNEMGRTPLFDATAWKTYPQIAKVLAAHDDGLDVDDLTRLIDKTPNLLHCAAEAKHLDVIFEPGLWAGRLRVMRTLWSHVKDSQKIAPMTTKAFDLAYADAESQTYAPLLSLDAVHAKEDLLRPLSADGEKPVIALGLKAFWDNHAARLAADLAARGDAIQLADLRRVSGLTQEPCLIMAAKLGRFRVVSEMLDLSQQRLQFKDFLLRDTHGNSLLSILTDRQELALVFKPELWVGRLPDMMALWKLLPPAAHAQVDIRQVNTEVRQATLRYIKKKAQGAQPR